MPRVRRNSLDTQLFLEMEDPSMRAMQIIEWGKPLEAREYPDPEPKGEEVLLRVEAAGVCHSDVHIWDGHFDLGGGQQISLESRGVRLPFTMGHEIAGEVAALGPQASGVEVGDKVVAYPWIGCGECAVCREGEELLCLTPRTLGTRRAGGYGTHVIVPHGRYLLPHEGVPQGLAATYTCSGITAFSALKKTRTHLGTEDHLVIIGAASAAVRCTSRRRLSRARWSLPTSTRRSARMPARWVPSQPSTTRHPMRSTR
jgi:D-arabinose 1-dehydrogenase-like Zn-dependent alcohol dehydrogenase